MADEFFGVLVGVVTDANNNVGIAVSVPGGPTVLMSPERAALVGRAIEDALDYCGYFEDDKLEEDIERGFKH